MSEQYDIYFAGQVMADHQPDQVKQSIGRIFGASGEGLDRLFSGQPVRVKRGVDQATAVKYRVAFRDAGALVEIRPTTSGAARADPGQSADTLTLLPPRSGSLADCAPAVVPALLPDISDMSLAPAGTGLDDSVPPPPLQVDTGGLTLDPPNSGSLEECTTTVEPAPLPDISGLKLSTP